MKDKNNLKGLLPPIHRMLTRIALDHDHDKILNQ